MGHADNTGTFDLCCCEYFHQNMSRRKQSNPKPVKRQADSEVDDTEMTEKLQSNEGEADENNQSDDLSQSEDETEPMESTNTNDIRERLSPSNDMSDSRPGRLENGCVSPSIADMVKKCHFPADILTLKKVEESVCHEIGIRWKISPIVPLPKGISMGPYKGEVVPLNELKEKEHILQAGDNKFTFVSLTEKTGAWLTLLRPADKSAEHNTCVFFEDERIWFETVEDLTVGTELIASFTIGTQLRNAERPTEIVKQEPTSASDEEEVNKTDDHSGGKTDIRIPHHLPGQPALIFGCPFCGVRFSSPRTLDAHITFYCSKKPPDLKLPQLSPQMSDGMEDDNKPASSDRGSTGAADDADSASTGIKRRHEDGSSDSTGSLSDTDAPKSKSPKSGQNFKCGSCDYTADRMSSLNRHKRIHSRGSEISVSSERLSISPVCQSETFCKDCNIQFSSVNTYRGHREFYCKFRRQEKNEDNVSVGSSPPPKDANKAALKLLSPPPMLLSGKGLLQPGTIPHPLHFGSSPLLMQTIPKDLQALLAGQKECELPSGSSSAHEITKAALEPFSHTDEQPLDLSTSKSKNHLIGENNEEKSKASSPVTVKTEPRNSPQHSPVSSTLLSPASQKLDRSTESLKLNSPTGRPTLKVPVFPVAPVQFVKNKPIPPMSSVSRCVECNIVFYKHENFLIHKEHYCSGRRGGITLAGEDQRMEQTGSETSQKVHTSPGSKSSQQEATKSRENVSPSSPKLSKGDNPQAKPKSNELCYLYLCIPCNIRFSSAGNLKAHKEFYCPHGKDNESACVVKDNADVDSDKTSSDSNDLYRCELCNSEYTSARLLKLHFCTGLATQAPLLRCPYCEYVTQTENRLGEHMKVHVPTKAFKCTICGYRGNTARGMRMHGKMHLENGEEFTDDNMVEFQEPPLVPVQRNGVCEKGPVDIETELIRMKNEPYKRRRSRKSFEKSENMPSYIGPDLLPQICAACGQAFANVNEFVIHLRMHEMAALEAMKNLKSLKCEHCDDYIAESLTGLLFHMHERHPEQLPIATRSENQSEGERSQSRDSHRSTSVENRSRSNSEESSRTSNSNSSQKDIEKSDKTVNKMYTFDQSDIPTSAVKQEKIDNSSLKEEVTSPNMKRNPVDFSSESRSVISEDDKKIESSNSPFISSNGHSLRQSSEVSADGSSRPASSSPPSRASPEAQQGSSLSKQPSVSPPGEHGWHFKNSSPISSHSPSVSPSEKLRSSPVRSKQVEPVSPPREPKIYSRQTESMPYIALHRSQVSPQQHSRSPWKRVSPVSSAIQPEPVSPVRAGQSENQRNSPFSLKKERVDSPNSLEKAPSSQRPSNPTTPTSQIAFPRNVISPHIQNFPLLYSPQALMQLYQFQHGIPVPGVSLPGGTANSTEASTEESNPKKYCEHCDIKFTYLSSFLTHKKYYCSARSSSEELSPSATA